MIGFLLKVDENVTIDNSNFVPIPYQKIESRSDK